MIPRSSRILFTLFAIFSLLLVSSGNAQQSDATKKELSDKVSQAIPILSKLQDEGNKWDEVIAQVDALLATVNPESFDRAFLSQLKVQA